MAGSLAAAGVGIAAVGLVGRTVLQVFPKFAPIVSTQLNNLAPSKYYRGGFQPSMTKAEAAQILGVSPLTNLKRIRGQLPIFLSYKLNNTEEPRNSAFKGTS